MPDLSFPRFSGHPSGKPGKLRTRPGWQVWRPAWTFAIHCDGQPPRMLKGLFRGAAAGAAGTTALNAITYLDMAWRGRPPSTAPQQAVEELANRAGQPIPGTGQERDNRLDGLGALAGVVTGVGVGALAGVLRPLVLRLGPILGPVLLGASAMTATDASLTRLGLTDPRQWDATAWLSDAGPHLAFGVATYATLRATTRR